MPDYKVKYPVADTIPLTVSLGGLGTNSAGAFVAGRESNVVDNRTNLDLDHLLSGRIRAGTTPTAARSIAVYVYTPTTIASGTPTFPDVITGADSARTITSANVLGSGLRLAWSTLVDATTDRDYFLPQISIASLFWGVMPPLWGVFVAHDTGVALNATGSNHFLHYHRVQTQSA